jgi:hypothetical protein
MAEVFEDAGESAKAADRPTSNGSGSIAPQVARLAGF